MDMAFTSYLKRGWVKGRKSTAAEVLKPRRGPVRRSQVPSRHVIWRWKMLISCLFPWKRAGDSTSACMAASQAWTRRTPHRSSALSAPIPWQIPEETVKKHGADQVRVWRRSFDVPPPPIDDDSEFNPAKACIRMLTITFAKLNKLKMKEFFSFLLALKD